MVAKFKAAYETVDFEKEYPWEYKYSDTKCEFYDEIPNIIDKAFEFAKNNDRINYDKQIEKAFLFFEDFNRERFYHPREELYDKYIEKSTYLYKYPHKSIEERE